MASHMDSGESFFGAGVKATVTQVGTRVDRLPGSKHRSVHKVAGAQVHGHLNRPITQRPS
jgi:hypothetical protein